MRASPWLIMCMALCAGGCIFGSRGEDNNGSAFDLGESDSSTTSSDMAEETDLREPLPDTGDPDMGGETEDLGAPADLGMDTSTPDLGVDTGTEDIGPDLPDPRSPSAVCDGMPGGSLTGSIPFRLRVDSNNARIFAGYVIPGSTAYLLSHSWSQWENSAPYWVSMFGYGGNLTNPDELDDQQPTGIAPLPVDGTGWVGVNITRRQTTQCVYVERQVFNNELDCGAAWAAETANTDSQTPYYFWIGENGTINSMPYDDVDPGGQYVSVPWCTQDPSDPTSCLGVNFNATDARGNNGPHVLISDSGGRSYLWNVVQNIDGSLGAIDCTTPPTAPVPIRLQGNPVLFENADVVRAAGDDLLVHQTANAVSLYKLDSNLQPMLPAVAELPNNGLRPHFDAATDGTRIAAAAGVGSDIRIFAFGAGGGVTTVVADDDDTVTIRALGITVKGDQVGIVVGIVYGNPNYVAAGNAYTVWTP